MPSSLGNEFVTRPGTMDDLDAYLELWNLVARQVLGRDDYTRHEVLMGWKATDWSPETHAHLVLTQTGQLVGFVDVTDDQVAYGVSRLNLVVHPDYEQTPVGAYLVEWAEARIKPLLATVPPEQSVMLRSMVRQGTTQAEQILAHGGFKIVRHFLRMGFEFDESPAPALWPAGAYIRPFVAGEDDHAVYSCIRAAFVSGWGRVSVPFDDGLRSWRQWNWEQPGIEAWMLPVVVNDAGEVIATANCSAVVGDMPGYGWLGNLAVLPEYRGRGIAQAILQHCLGEFYTHEFKGLALGVDAENETGAVRLYEKVGMQAVMRFDMWAKTLREGVAG